MTDDRTTAGDQSPAPSHGTAPTPAATAPHRTLAARALLGMIRVYQGARAGRPSPCRFVPSCSAYGHEAIEVHGALRGGRLTVARILRCRPGGPSGVDLVPPPHVKG